MLLSGFTHVSSLVVLSRAFLYDHSLFFTYLSYHTPRTLSTSRTSPSSLSRQVAPSRITLAWRPAECRNPRNTTPTGCEPNELATVSRIEAYSGDPYQLFDVQEKFGEEDLRAPITEEVEEFKEIGTAGAPDSKISETSYFQSQMQFDYSLESTADSDLEDGDLQKKLTSPLYAQKAFWRHGAMVMQEREVSAQYTQADRKESLRSLSSEGQKALGKRHALFSSEQGNLIRSSAFRNANPVELERISA